MKVGLYFDLRVPPASGLDPARVYAHALEVCQEAEHLGLDSVWVSEHHGFDDGYLPQALTFAAAVAARTRTIRIGTALVVAPLHATVELAEQVYQIRSNQAAAVLEGTFAPRTPDAPEGDGYIIVPVSWWAERRGEYLVFDTDDITHGPICRIEIPFLLGWTPHGHWMDFRK